MLAQTSPGALCACADVKDQLDAKTTVAFLFATVIACAEIRLNAATSKARERYHAETLNMGHRRRTIHTHSSRICQWSYSINVLQMQIINDSISC